MKRFFKFLLSLFALYLLFWGALAAYFSFADEHRDVLESNLSSMFGRPVTISKVTTAWDGFTPQFQIENLTVSGDTPEQAAFTIDSLSAELDPVSLLKFWPIFEEFAVEAPQLEVVSLNDGSLQVAGFKLRQSDGQITDRIFNWLLDQKNAVWHNGTLVWRREGKQAQNFDDISFVYQRDQQNRKFNAAIETAKGTIAFKAQALGDLLSQRDWGANIEVLGSGGRRLLSADDLSAEVIDGEGELTLKTLSVERIQDFLQFAGLTPEQHWLLAADVSGRLHDLKFYFSGPLLSIDDWSLRGSASNIGFRSQGDAPSMNNLSGDVTFSKNVGSFRFATQDAEFRWPARFYHSFPIDSATGELQWQQQASGNWDVYVKDASYEDSGVKVEQLNAHVSIVNEGRRIDSFGDLFKVNSVIDLDFDDGAIVVGPTNSPPNLKANAKFAIKDITRLSEYLPKFKSLDLFRAWSEAAFQSGVASNGRFSYEGELSPTAINAGQASLRMTADFEKAHVDYSPKLGWPAVTRASGKASLDNQLLRISPSVAWMNGDPLSQSEIVIERLLQADSTLYVDGTCTTSLEKGIEFLFKGPLIKPEKRLKRLPFVALDGDVDIDVRLSMPLRKLQDFKLEGTTLIRNGRGILPSNMPLENLQGKITFTENTVNADDLTASFLGGQMRANLVTVTPAKPPVMRLTAQGTAKAENLVHWVGEHVLTLISGETNWQGVMDIENNSLAISGTSDLNGLTVDAPAPLGKKAEQSSRFELGLGIAVDQFDLDLNYADMLNASFATVAANDSLNQQNRQSSIFDRTMISLRDPLAAGAEIPAKKEGINFDLRYPQLDLDEWLSTIIDLASYQAKATAQSSVFLDAMRSVELSTQASRFLGRDFGAVDMNILSVDGKTWIGRLGGENMQGTMRLEPRKDSGHYEFNLARMNVPDAGDVKQALEVIDHSLQPSDYPRVNLLVDQFSFDKKPLGQLDFQAAPQQNSWKVNTLTIKNNGLTTSADGAWVNTAQEGSISRLKFETVIDEAGGALDDLNFEGIIRKGKGSVVGTLNWIGAPHEFDYARLNGDFNAFVTDGELVQVEPGGGKIVGLLNMNAILRRLVFDFSDVVATGLRFDRMRFAGVLADGDAVVQDAFVLSPAVFVTMEGNVNLDQELIDMEIHVSPELGGNIALLSALANPAAGAVVFLTQQLFKDDLRRSSFRSFRALGSWEDFELEEMGKTTKSQAAEQALESDELNEVPLPILQKEPLKVENIDSTSSPE